jgi:hypothetical protein
VRTSISLALAVVLMASASAQSNPPAASTPAETLIGIYASGVPSSHPQPTGGSFIAINTGSSGIWSITGTDYSATPQRTVQAASWTGVATPVLILGHTVYGCLGVGGATTLTNSGYVVTGCGIAAFPIRGGKWRQLLISPVILKSSIGGTQALVRIGWGFLKQ